MFSFIFSFKQLITTVTGCKKATFKYLQKMDVLHQHISCPGPLLNGKCQGGCDSPMILKETGDTKDIYMWHCRWKHKIENNGCVYTVKDVKINVCHMSWLVDTKLGLNIVLELVYLWS